MRNEKALIQQRLWANQMMRECGRKEEKSLSKFGTEDQDLGEVSLLFRVYSRRDAATIGDLIVSNLIILRLLIVRDVSSVDVVCENTKRFPLSKLHRLQQIDRSGQARAT